MASADKGLEEIPESRLTFQNSADAELGIKEDLIRFLASSSLQRHGYQAYTTLQHKLSPTMMKSPTPLTP